MEEALLREMDRKSVLKARFEECLQQGVAAMALEHGYTLDGAAPALSEDDEQTLHRMLLERVFAKRLRDFDFDVHDGM